MSVPFYINSDSVDGVVSGVKRKYSFMDPGSDSGVVLDQGNQSIFGVKRVKALYADTVTEDTVNAGVTIDEVRTRTDTLVSPAITVSSIVPVSASTNVGLAFVPKGTGAVTSAIPDNTTAGGNARGQYATDLQRFRILASQVASGNYSTIVGGINNIASGQGSTVCGGENNTSSGLDSVAVSGLGNFSTGSLSTVVGGQGNTASGDRSFVGAGGSCSAQGTESVVSGGSSNVARATFSGIVSGANNLIDVSSLGSGILSGFGNDIILDPTGSLASISGGQDNTITGLGLSHIGGGITNTISGQNGFVGCGSGNSVSGVRGSIINGTNNVASGQDSLASGDGCTASAPYSTAIGRFSTAANTGSVVFTDATAVAPAGALASTNDHQLTFGFTGGVRFMRTAITSFNDKKFFYLQNSITTVGATTADLFTIPMPANSSSFFSVETIGMTGANAVALQSSVRAKNIIGTVTIGTPFNVQSNADVALTTTAHTWVVSGTNVIYRVTGVAAQTITFTACLSRVQRL